MGFIMTLLIRGMSGAVSCTPSGWMNIMILDDLHLPAGIKIAHNMPAEPTADDLDFLRALGVRYVTTWAQPDKATPDYYPSRKQLYGDAGFTLHAIRNPGVHNQHDIVLT